jgi:hypothetical protein
MDWFQRLTGFSEQDYASTKRSLELIGERLHSTVNLKSYSIGRLEVVSLAVLRERTREHLAGRIANTVVEVRGDIRQLHAAPENAGALFQVASQFNLLEMVGPEITPEHGVTRYQFDHTQGPACAIAAGAATIYRNYFAPVGNHSGQFGARQINCLDDLGDALGHGIQPLWRYRNGYILCFADGLNRIRQHIAAADSAELDRFRGLLKVGIHWDVEVTDAPNSPGPLVSQVFCSALPVAYSDLDSELWAPFARLILEAAYEATLLAAVLNSHEPGGSNRVLLTHLGGGAFGNRHAWINAAIERALEIVNATGLEILHVSR